MVLKKHTNELLKVIIETGRDVNDFELKRHRNSSVGEAVQIVYKDSPMSFWVMPHSTDSLDVFKIAQVQFLPNFPENISDYPYNLTEVKEIFKGWLSSHLAEYVENLMETDYWEIIKTNPLTIDSIDFTKNEPFSLDEQKQLKLGLEEIKVLLAENFGLTKTQIELVHKRMDYLSEATERLKKTDWKGITISTIVAIAYDLSFDEYKRSMLFGLFSKLWAIVQQLPPTIII